MAEYVSGEADDLQLFRHTDCRLSRGAGQTRTAALGILSRPYVLFDVNSGGMSFRVADAGETVPELVDQLEQIPIEEQYRWKIYKIPLPLSGGLPGAVRASLSGCPYGWRRLWSPSCPLAQESYDHWEQYFQSHSFPDLLEQLTNQEVEADGLDTYINLSMLAANDMIYTYGTPGGRTSVRFTSAC